MAKVGLKDTLTLLAKGYTKKEIDALAAADEEQEEKKDEKEDPVPPAEEKKDPEPDYKQLYEDLKKDNDATKAKLTKLQQDNVHKDSTPAAAEEAKKQSESLTNLVRSFM